MKVNVNVILKAVSIGLTVAGTIVGGIVTKNETNAKLAELVAKAAEKSE